MSKFKKLNKRLAKIQHLKKVKADCDIISDHFIAKIKYQKLIKLKEIQVNKNDRKFKIKIEFDLTLKIIFIKMLKSSDMKKMKSFKTLCSITVSCNLKLTSLILFKKCFNKNVFKNKMKKIKITLN